MPEPRGERKATCEDDGAGYEHPSVREGWLTDWMEAWGHGDAQERLDWEGMDYIRTRATLGENQRE